MASSIHDVDGVGCRDGPGVGPRVDCGADGPGVGDGVDGPGVGSGGLTVVDSVGRRVGGYNFKVGASVGRHVGQVPHVAGEASIVPQLPRNATGGGLTDDCGVYRLRFSWFGRRSRRDGSRPSWDGSEGLPRAVGGAAAATSLGVSATFGVWGGGGAGRAGDAS